MGVHVSDDGNVFLFDSVSGLPLATEPFSSADHANDFIEWLKARADADHSLEPDARELDNVQLKKAYVEWFAARVDALTGFLLEVEAEA